MSANFQRICSARGISGVKVSRRDSTTFRSYFHRAPIIEPWVPCQPFATSQVISRGNECTKKSQSQICMDRWEEIEQCTLHLSNSRLVAFFPSNPSVVILFRGHGIPNYLFYFNDLLVNNSFSIRMSSRAGALGRGLFTEASYRRVLSERVH